MANKKIAVVLSGCGHQDGSEITEAVSTLIALTEAGAEPTVFAPQIPLTVKDPLTSEPTGEKRDVLHESARISRGHIRELGELRAADFDGLALPGGFGAALNLSSWATEGAKGPVLPDLARALKEFHAAAKPIVAICIAPAVVARVLGAEGVTVTIGRDRDTAAEIEKTGARHEDCAVDDFITDRDHRVITTPAYMYDDAKPSEVFTGIRKAIRELVEMA